ncbi:hypothetical protein F3D17_26790, partial [Bacteroides ovatus]
FGTVTKDGKDGFLMIGYDDIYSIEYVDEKRKGYVVCALMILVSCLYLVYLGYSLYRMGHA